MTHTYEICYNLYNAENKCTGTYYATVDATNQKSAIQTVIRTKIKDARYSITYAVII